MKSWAKLLLCLFLLGLSIGYGINDLTAHKIWLLVFCDIPTQAILLLWARSSVWNIVDENRAAKELEDKKAVYQRSLKDIDDAMNDIKLDERFRK